MENRALLSVAAARPTTVVPPAPLRVVLVSDAVRQAEQVASAPTPGVVALTYDGRATDSADLVDRLAALSAEHGGARIAQLGLVAHGSEGRVSIGSGDSWDAGSLAGDQATLDRLRGLLTSDARLDLYSCSVAAGSDGKAFVDQLAARTGADVFASDDAVGSGALGDFTWEYSTHASPTKGELLSSKSLERISDLKLDDAYEDNDSKFITDGRSAGAANSPNLGLLTSTLTIPNLAMADAADWYKFQTSGVGTTNNSVSIHFAPADGDLDLYLYASNGTTLLDYANRSGAADEVISLAGVPSGTYYAVVVPRSSGVTNPNYTFQIAAPAATGDDAYEDNDTKLITDGQAAGAANSPNLGVLTTTRTIANLVMNDAADWYKFQLSGVGTTANSVDVAMDPAQGDVDVYLYASNGTTLLDYANRAGVADEVISLAGVPSGTYYLKVFPRNAGFGLSRYTLSIAAPAATGDDAYEDNDSKAVVDTQPVGGANSPNLGVLTTTRTALNLVMNDAADWYKFQTATTGIASSVVHVSMDPAQGDVDVYLYASNGTTLLDYANHSGAADEVISLNGVAAGVYYIKVFPRTAGFGLSSYNLQIVPPPSGPQAGIFRFGSPAYSVNEDGGMATINVTRTDGSDVAATVHYATSNGTATAGGDYTAASGTLSFAIGEVSKTFTVPITDDTLAEGNETINLTLTAPTGGATLGSQSTATLTIVDNDLGGTLRFSNPAYSVAEDGGSATITVTRTGGSAGGVTVRYATSNGTATAGGDYTAASGTLSFAAGETTKTFTVPIADDSLSEGNETINLALTSPTGGSLGTQSGATLTIVDNDLGGTLRFSNPAYSVAEDGGSATITVTRTGGSAGGVTVRYATSNGTATAGGDYTAASGTLSFAAGETTKTFTVPIADDSLSEGNETINLTLSVATGGASLGTQSTATLTIVDNESAPTARVIDNDGGSPGYVEAGTGWAASGIAGYGGTTRYHAAGDASQTATWTAAGLAPGTFDVQVTWGAAAARATNAPYRIYDGATLIATVRIDQTKAPAGAVVGGVAFQSLGRYTITGSTLRVVLGSDANSLVSADAVRIVGTGGSSARRTAIATTKASPAASVSVPLSRLASPPASSTSTTLSPGLGFDKRPWSTFARGDGLKRAVAAVRGAADQALIPIPDLGPEASETTATRSIKGSRPR